MHKRFAAASCAIWFSEYKINLHAKHFGEQRGKQPNWLPFAHQHKISEK